MPYLSAQARSAGNKEKCDGRESQHYERKLACEFPAFHFKVQAYRGEGSQSVKKKNSHLSRLFMFLDRVVRNPCNVLNAFLCGFAGTKSKQGAQRGYYDNEKRNHFDLLILADNSIKKRQETQEQTKNRQMGNQQMNSRWIHNSINFAQSNGLRLFAG
jgi:hypothetical protein